MTTLLKRESLYMKKAQKKITAFLAPHILHKHFNYFENYFYFGLFWLEYSYGYFMHISVYLLFTGSQTHLPVQHQFF